MRVRVPAHHHPCTLHVAGFCPTHVELRGKRTLFTNPLMKKVFHDDVTVPTGQKKVEQVLELRSFSIIQRIGSPGRGLVHGRLCESLQTECVYCSYEQRAIPLDPQRRQEKVIHMNWHDNMVLHAGGNRKEDALDSTFRKDRSDLRIVLFEPIIKRHQAEVPPRLIPTHEKFDR